MRGGAVNFSGPSVPLTARAFRFGDGFVPLQYAIMHNGDAEAVAMLVKAGASPTRAFLCAVDGKSYTCLSYAGALDSLAVSRAFLTR